LDIERRDFREEPPRQGLETWISFSPSIVEWADQPMRHGSLSSKIQATAADVFKLDVDVCKGRSENQAACDVDRIRDPSGWKLCQGVQLGVRQMTGDRRSVVFWSGGKGVGF